MKHSFCKLVALLAISFFVANTLAQDIIVTNDSKKIEAKILEVSKIEIKYKELDNLEGPTFVLGVEDINSIIYANGKVALYNNQQLAEKSVQTQTAQEATKQGVNVDFEIKSTSNPHMYRFVNLSSGVTEFRWDFGDGTWGLSKDEALRTYEKDGTYIVTLTATVGNQKYTKQKTLTVGDEGGVSQEQSEHLQQPVAESGAQLGQAIKNLIEVNNSYALDVKNTTKYPYRINLDGHILGVVNPYKTERFIVPVEYYGRMQAVQTSGYTFSPTVKEFKIPRQQKQTACIIIIK